MIIKDEQIKAIDKKIEDMSKGLKKGFWAGWLWCLDIQRLYNQ